MNWQQNFLSFFAAVVLIYGVVTLTVELFWLFMADNKNRKRYWK